MTDTGARPRPPVPRSVSQPAQQFLATVTPMDLVPPPLDDGDGWLAYVAQGDQRMLDWFVGVDDLPVTVAETEIAGVPTFVVCGPDVTDDGHGPIYIDIHGGGLVLGGGDLCRMTATTTAMANRMITWSPDYRMPPRHPYPASLDDCLSVYREALQLRSPEDLVVGGASAGGNLAAALIVRARDEGLPMPAALVLLTPEVDLTESGDTFQTNHGIDYLGSLMQANLLYANGHDLSHPYLSPLFADVSGFPPTFLQAGTRDLYLSNTVRMHRKLRAAGIEAELHVFEAMPHGGFGGAPEDAELRSEVRRFLTRHRRTGD